MLLYQEKNNQGFASIAEVMISAVIFAIASLGILATITSLQPHTAQSEKRLQAMYIAKGVMEELYQYVDATTWNNTGSPVETDLIHNLTYGDYNVAYYLEDVPNLELRKLTINVTYP